jgi:hypothetical protein
LGFAIAILSYSRWSAVQYAVSVNLAEAERILKNVAMSEVVQRDP